MPPTDERCVWDSPRKRRRRDAAVKRELRACAGGYTRFRDVRCRYCRGGREYSAAEKDECGRAAQRERPGVRLLWRSCGTHCSRVPGKRLTAATRWLDGDA